MTTAEIVDARNYMSGDCQRLAAAIERVTYWSIGFVDGAGCHVVAHTPDGQYLDWEGLHTGEQLRQNMQAPGSANLPQIQHLDSVDDLGWLGTNPEICDYEAARTVLERAGLLTDTINDRIDYQIETLRLRESE